jgi:hypothetical protein
MRVALQTLLNQAPRLGNPRRMSVRPVASQTRTLPGMTIIGFPTHREPAPAHPGRPAHPPGCVAGCQARSRSVQRGLPEPAQPSVIIAQRPRIFHARFRRGYLHWRKTRPDLLDRSRLPPPREHYARRNRVAARNLRHLRPRAPTFPRRSASCRHATAIAAARPRLIPQRASPDDLKARLKVTTFVNIPLKQDGPCRTRTIDAWWRCVKSGQRNPRWLFVCIEQSAPRFNDTLFRGGNPGLGSFWNRAGQHRRSIPDQSVPAPPAGSVPFGPPSPLIVRMRRLKQDCNSHTRRHRNPSGFRHILIHT